MRIFPVSPGAPHALYVRLYKSRDGSAKAKPAGSATRRRNAARRSCFLACFLDGRVEQRGPADNRDQRIAFVLDPCGEMMRLDMLEPGLAQIQFDQPCVARIVEAAPDRDGLGPEAAVREADRD